jgi:hypothetical protein
VDFLIKRLFSFNRLSLDVYQKLMLLRKQDGENYLLPPKPISAPPTTSQEVKN